MKAGGTGEGPCPPGGGQLRCRDSRAVSPGGSTLGMVPVWLGWSDRGNESRVEAGSPGACGLCYEGFGFSPESAGGATVVGSALYLFSKVPSYCCAENKL